MKEATGELNVTVITVIAIAAIAGLFYTVLWPVLQRSIMTRTCETYGNGYKAIKSTTQLSDGTGKTYKWACCPADATSATDPKCAPAD